MQAHELTDLVAAVSALMERFERRAQLIEMDLQQLAHQLPATVRAAADAEIQRLPVAVIERIGAGLEQPVTDYQRRLQEDSRQLRQAAHTLSDRIQRMQALHRHLIWKIAGIALGSLALVLAGGGWLSKHYYDEIRRNQMSAELLKAYNAADVTLCDGRLCANVDAAGQALGDHSQYRPVHLRR